MKEPKIKPSIERKLFFEPELREEARLNYPSLLTTSKCKEVKIELQMARELRNSYDMKESKIKRAIEDGSVIYSWILLPSDEYFLLSPDIFKHREPVPNPRWGGKKIYTISISEVKEKIGESIQ